MKASSGSNMIHQQYCQCLLLLLLGAASHVSADTIFRSGFEYATGGFRYSDNVFRGTVGNAAYASGFHQTGLRGQSSFLQVDLGGIDNITITNGMSGGWSKDIAINQTSSLSIDIDYRLLFNKDYKKGEFTQVLCSINGVLLGLEKNNYIVQANGDGNGGVDTIIGFTVVTLTTPVLQPGTHRIIIGGFNNRKTTIEEQSQIRFNRISINRIPVLPQTPTRSPIIAPVKTPIRLPTTAPVKIPVRVPIRSPTKFPTRKPTLAPIKFPVRVPTKIPVKTPTRKPTRAPTKLPIRKPTTAPVISNNATFAIRISSGATVDWTDSNNVIWESDKYFGDKGGVYSLCPLQIVGAPGTMSSLYCKERFFNIFQHTQPFRYDIPVPRSGTYSVKLHFAETFYKNPGSRIFDVWIDGSLAMKSFDIVAEVGYATALVTTKIVTIRNTLVSIEFLPKIENPKICAIEVIEIPNYIPPPTGAPVAAPFQSILINSGGDDFVESSGVRTFGADRYFIGGSTYADGSNGINQTVDDRLYQSERNGEFRYEIPLPVGSYELVMHFAELYWQGIGQRVFNIMVEDTMSFANVDLVKLGGGSRLEAFTLDMPVTVTDGFLSIAFSSVNPKKDSPKVSAIEVNFLEPHLAHSVSNGPYIATDISNIGSASLKVDGSFSHSHATGAEVVQWTWKEGSQVIGVGPTPTFTLSVGVHTITVTIVDNFSNTATDTTTVTVNPFGYPAITGIDPLVGKVAGGQKITIKGSGFNHAASAIKVNFGRVLLTGASVTVVDQFTIEVVSPTATVAAPVSIVIQTPLGTSNSQFYTYQSTSPINFTSDVLTRDISHPTSAAFGPDGRLYVGTLYGTLARIHLDDSFTQVLSTATAEVAPFRAILGIAFDPLQTSGIPDVFITTSFFFHGSPLSSGGLAINGNVKKVGGTNLDIITDIVTGLPVSDHDHGMKLMTLLLRF
jgi:Malectin domain/IPT/TIG domain